MHDEGPSSVNAKKHVNFDPKGRLMNAAHLA